jgi:phage terminase large subunit-like protein
MRGLSPGSAPDGRATAAPLIEAKLRELRERYSLRWVGYDRWQLDDMAARLRSEGLPMVEFGQKNDHMVPASQLTFDLINDRTLVHDGDRAFRSHVLGTGAELTATGGWRFVKAKTKTGNRDLSKNNDACIALAMAVAGWRAESSLPKESSFAATGGVWTIDL